MFKVFVVLALAFVAVAAQEAAPEPYSYAYQTDTHAASEQRDQSGKVTGFYTLTDTDGRERRVEYVADEAGFRAKVATNEVGTKSENPADVEIVASEPTPQQYVAYQQSAQVQASPQAFYQQRPQVYQQTVGVAPQRVSTTTTTVQQQQPFRSQTAYYQQQPGYNYGYNSGAYYGANYYGPAQAYGPGYGYGNVAYGVSAYNNRLPSQYYRSSTSTSSVVPSAYTVGGANSVRYVTQPGVTTTGVRTVTYPAGGVSYGVPSSSSVRTVSSSSNSAGSSNYLVLQKREAENNKN